MRTARPAAHLSAAASYTVTHGIVPALIATSAFCIPHALSGDRCIPLTSVSAVGNTLDAQRDDILAGLAAIEHKINSSLRNDEEIIVPNPPATRHLVGVITRVQADIRMPETASDYDHLI